MCRIDFKLVCGLWCALVLCAAGQDVAPPKVHRIDNPEERMRQRANSGEQPDPHRPMSPEMKEISNHPDLLDNLAEEDLAKMSLDEPLLKWAYADVFLNCMGPFEQLNPRQELVLADIRRRGEAVSPMFLKLIEENQETRIESSVLAKIEHLNTVRLDPFLEYARKLLRERTRSDVVAVASGLLARHGIKGDVELFEWVLQQRPFAITDLANNLKILRDRLASQTATRPERRDKSSPAAGGVGLSDGPEKNHPKNELSAASRVKPWIIGGLILAALLGACRLLFKRLRG